MSRRFKRPGTKYVWLAVRDAARRRTRKPKPVVIAAQSGCTRNVTVSTFRAAYDQARANAVLCLAAGSYGRFTASLRSSNVTIRPQPGAVVSMELHFEPASNITIDGLVITRALLGDSRTKNITVRNSDFPGPGIVTMRGGEDDLENANVLFDNNVHHDWNADDGCNCGDAMIGLPNRSSEPSGVTIRNSEFRGGRSDGISNGHRGARILYNEFHHKPGDPEIHVDAIQLFGSAQTVIRGNWFHHLANGVGIIMAADGVDHELVEDNLFGPANRRPWVDWFSDNGSTIRHNTFLDGPCEFNARCGQLWLGSKDHDPAGHGTVIRDNIMTAISCCNGRAAFTADHNLIRGRPVFTGPPGRYRGYRLARSSPGKGAASDGLDVGIRYR